MLRPMKIETPSPASLTHAAELLRGGALVAFPTETVYGLGGDATNDLAVAAIFAAKGRPSFNPLIVHVASLAQAESIAFFDARAQRIAATFWPGPLTLVLPRRPEGGISLLATAGLSSVALRWPAHPVAASLIAAAGRPIAAPSANRSGQISPTNAQHVADSLGERVPLILDGGPCAVGVESSVLDLSGEAPVLLRPGGVTREELEIHLGPVLLALDSPDAPKSPGQLLSHYAPRLPVRLNALSAEHGEALLAFGPGSPNATANLSPSGDLREAAAHLFALLHQLDQPGYTGIAVMPIPDEGLGLAINDRLTRAAAPRPLGSK